MESPARRLLVVAGLVWLAPDRVLVQRRGARAAHGAAMVEFPGGKVEAGEAPTAALARELVEEWGEAARALRIGPIAEVLHHDYPPPGPEVVLLLYHVDGAALVAQGSWEGRLVPADGATPLDFACQALPAEEFLAADRALVERLRRGSIRPPWAPTVG